MLMQVFLPNLFNHFKMWVKVSIMVMLSTYNTWLTGLELSITWGSRVVVPLLLRRGYWRLVPIWLVLWWGIITSLLIVASSILLVIISGLVVLISSLLILHIRLDHVNPNLMGCPGRCFCLRSRGLWIWN